MTTEATPAGATPAESTPALPVPPASTIEGNPAPSAAAPAEQVKTEPGEAPAENEGQGNDAEEIKAKKRSARQRIAELTAQKYALQAELDSQRQEISRLRKPLEIPRDRDLTLDEQDALRVREAVRQERADELESETRRKEAQAMAAQAAMFEKRIEEVADRIPDIRDKLSDPTLPISPYAAEFLSESERGAEVAYWLATNRNEAARINGLHPLKQAAELARIESRLQAAPQVRKTSQAPNPPPMVGGGVSPGPKDPANMSQAEYNEWYRKRGKGR
jgi:chromosome segregation ATPase